MAASRWMGRGDKMGADGAAVEAMRTVLSSVPMDGIVVIGEGEKDNAPMLFNGEKIGDGTPPLTDIAVDPIDGTTLDRPGPRRRAGRHRRGRAGRHVRPRPVRLHGEAGRGAAGQGRLRHPAHADREPPRPLRGPGAPGPRPDRRHPRPAPPRRPHRRGAGHRGPHPPHHRRRRGRCHRHRLARRGHRHPLRHRRHARGRAGRGRAQVHGRGDPGQALPPQRAGAGRGHRGRATTSTPC